MDWWWIVFAAVRAVSPAPDDQWATRLSALDHVRAEAFAASDPTRLEDVYVSDSPVLEADRAIMRDYTSRGARVVGAELRVLRCRILDSSPSRVRLDVVDRLDSARIVWHDQVVTPLPVDQPSRRTVTLVRTSDGWRIAGSS